MDYKYAASKLSSARRLLMLPHPHGEVSSIASAFHECELGLRDVDRDRLDDSARGWFDTIQRTMNTDGLSDPDGVGLWAVKAATLEIDDMYSLSEAINELHYWFDRQNG